MVPLYYNDIFSKQQQQQKSNKASYLSNQKHYTPKVWSYG